MEIPAYETGINTIALDDKINSRVLFTFQYRENWSNHTYTISFDRVEFINKILGYNLTGERRPEFYNTEIDKLYDLYSFNENFEAYRNRGSIDIIEIIPHRSAKGNFDMTLDGDIFEKFSGEYSVDCFLGTSR